MTTIDVLEPAGQVQKLVPLQLNAMPALAGCRLAILDNLKPNFQQLSNLIAEKLKRDHRIGSIHYFSKENAAVAAKPELLDRIAQSADMVLTGSAD